MEGSKKKKSIIMNTDTVESALSATFGTRQNVADKANRPIKRTSRYCMTQLCKSKAMTSKLNVAVQILSLFVM